MTIDPYLLDTHVLLWTALDSPSLGADARGIIGDVDNEISFRAATIWEIVIKLSLGRPDLRVDAARLRERPLLAGSGELPIRAAHVLEVRALPSIHSDPFNRIWLVQARIEGATLLTGDEKLLAYGNPAHRV